MSLKGTVLTAGKVCCVILECIHRSDWEQIQCIFLKINQTAGGQMLDALFSLVAYYIPYNINETRNAFSHVPACFDLIFQIIKLENGFQWKPGQICLGCLKSAK